MLLCGLYKLAFNILINVGAHEIWLITDRFSHVLAQLHMEHMQA